LAINRSVDRRETNRYKTSLVFERL
jgi:hypothetical protein